jgi:uncharacterized SAM-binding protein YcdF (DUF218 family)
MVADLFAAGGRGCPSHCGRTADGDDNIEQDFVKRRIFILIGLVWLLGFVVFAVNVPNPAGTERTDAIVVLTGAKGRLARGLAMLEQGRANRMFISGVDPSVREEELVAVMGRDDRLFKCCIDLGKQAVDTKTNALETAVWVKQHRIKSLRLVTTDWHMIRAKDELEHAMGDGVTIIPDAVESEPSLLTLFNEYNKFLLRHVAMIVGY